MRKGITFAGILGDLHRLLAAVAAPAEELPRFEPFRRKLQEAVAEALPRIQGTCSVPCPRRHMDFSGVCDLAAWAGKRSVLTSILEQLKMMQL